MVEAATVFLGKIALQALISESIKKIVNKKWRWETDEGKKILEHFQVADIRDKFSSKIKNNVLTFRSLSQGGKNVNLEDVYYPLTVTVKDSNDTFQVTDETIIKHKGTVVISGSAGQGKTTVLRKLFIEEIKNRERFPFFITLRNIIFRSDITLIEIFIAHLHEFGIDVKEEDASQLLQSSNIVLFFDGFDEISNKYRAIALNILKSAWNRYTCPVVVTTRPNTELFREGGFKNLIVNPLVPDDINGIIERSVGDEETRNALGCMLQKKKFILDALIYPILVDIFIVSFYSMKDTPATIGDFYSGLFRSLLFSHDQQKNFSREKSSGLDVRELQDCFNCFSLISFLGDVQDFDENELDNFFIEVCEMLDRKEGYKTIKEDIVDGTNLISINGYKYYSYIHRSIQEYHAALYISGLDEAKDHYKKLSFVTDYGYMTFLSFLESINDKKFYLYYVIPYLKSLGLSDLTNQNLYKLKHIIDKTLHTTTLNIQISEENNKLMSFGCTFGRASKFLRRLDKMEYLNSLLSGTLNNEALANHEIINFSGLDRLIKEESFLSLAYKFEHVEQKLSIKDEQKPLKTIKYSFNISDICKSYPEFVECQRFYDRFIHVHHSIVSIYNAKISPKINAKDPNEKIRSLIRRK